MLVQHNTSFSEVMSRPIMAGMHFAIMLVICSAIAAGLWGMICNMLMREYANEGTCIPIPICKRKADR